MGVRTVWRTALDSDARWDSRATAGALGRIAGAMFLPSGSPLTVLGQAAPVNRVERLDPVQQHAADPGLERLDPLAHRGGRDVQLAGRCLEGAEPDGDGQCAQGHRVELGDVFHT